MIKNTFNFVLTLMARLMVIGQGYLLLICFEDKFFFYQLYLCTEDDA